ncbi:hypothetical protein DEO72_LG7g1294 [Vigna unguiculata]|uniref:Uncharacterized protein n=1 Tax=Vigna unguiculata TaxID=3917 RepID=A0A4D6MG70_VIGUN|nr:hypothetical protein DEO72_LG7g1294 [Vigna unguiculata]
MCRQPLDGARSHGDEGEVSHLQPSVSSLHHLRYLSSRHSDSEEEGTVFDSSCSDSVQRDDEDSVGVEEFSALRHLGYKWVDPRVKLPLPRASQEWG